MQAHSLETNFKALFTVYLLQIDDILLWCFSLLIVRHIYTLIFKANEKLSPRSLTNNTRL